MYAQSVLAANTHRVTPWYAQVNVEEGFGGGMSVEVLVTVVPFVYTVTSK
jgi:hypothetical protein